MEIGRYFLWGLALEKLWAGGNQRIDKTGAVFPRPASGLLDAALDEVIVAAIRFDDVEIVLAPAGVNVRVAGVLLLFPFMVGFQRSRRLALVLVGFWYEHATADRTAFHAPRLINLRFQRPIQRQNCPAEPLTADGERNHLRTGAGVAIVKGYTVSALAVEPDRKRRNEKHQRRYSGEAGKGISGIHGLHTGPNDCQCTEKLRYIGVGIIRGGQSRDL